MGKFFGIFLVVISACMFLFYFFPNMEEMCPFDFFFCCIPLVMSLPLFFVDE